MENKVIRRISKPIRVYVLTIILFVRLGVFQFVRYWSEIQNASGNVPFILVFISFFLAGFTMLAVVWAYFGDDLGRIMLLIFVSLNVLWWFFLTISAIANSDSNNLEWIRFTPELIQPTVWLVLTWWYFTKKDVVAYYKQNV